MLGSWTAEIGERKKEPYSSINNRKIGFYFWASKNGI